MSGTKMLVTFICCHHIEIIWSRFINKVALHTYREAKQFQSLAIFHIGMVTIMDTLKRVMII